jgi:probable phosphoglycerate mutase
MTLDMINPVAGIPQALAPSANRPGSAAPETPAQLCLTRHGETDWNITGILQGWIDVPLNETGRRQSWELAETLAGFAFAVICTSPLRRSAETAEIIAQAWGLPPPVVDEGLKERHFGRIQGRTKQELALTHPGLHQEIIRRNPACQFDEGECIDRFADRVLGAIESIALAYVGQRVLVVTHGWVMDVVTRQVRQLPRDRILDMKRKNGESLWIQMGAEAIFTEISPPDEVASHRTGS